jgi:hypothetical protein
MSAYTMDGWDGRDGVDGWPAGASTRDAPKKKDTRGEQ